MNLPWSFFVWLLMLHLSFIFQFAIVIEDYQPEVVPYGYTQEERELIKLITY